MVDENFKTLHLFGLVEKEGETVQGKQTHLCNHVAHRLDINLGLRENFGRFVSQGLDTDDFFVLVVALSTPVDLTLVVVVVPTFTYDPFGAALEAVDERYRITPSALVILQKAISPSGPLSFVPIHLATVAGSCFFRKPQTPHLQSLGGAHWLRGGRHTALPPMCHSLLCVDCCCPMIQAKRLPTIVDYLPPSSCPLLSSEFLSHPFH